MPTSRSYHSFLIESLKDPQEAAAYLEAVLEDCTYDELFLALRNVAEAKLDFSSNPQITYRQKDIQDILSLQDKPDLAALSQVLGELGFKLSVTPLEDAA